MMIKEGEKKKEHILHFLFPIRYLFADLLPKIQLGTFFSSIKIQPMIVSLFMESTMASSFKQFFFQINNSG